ISTPHSIWRSTTHRTAAGRRMWKSVFPARSVLRPPSISSSKSRGRGRFPAWETRMRSVLCLMRLLFRGNTAPVCAALSLAQLLGFFRQPSPGVRPPFRLEHLARTHRQYRYERFFTRELRLERIDELP